MFGKRILYGGIGIAIVWLVFLTVPLWLRGVDHPLTASAVVDVCAYVTDAVLATLPEAPKEIARGFPGDPDTGKPACQITLPGAPDGAPRGVWLGVTTERMMNTGGRPGRTDRFVDTWLAESRADGNEVTPVKGPWRRAAVLRMPRQPDRQSLLADDAGIVVWINGQGIEDAAFVAFAGAMLRSLRAKPPIAAKRRGRRDLPARTMHRPGP